MSEPQATKPDPEAEAPQTELKSAPSFKVYKPSDALPAPPPPPPDDYFNPSPADLKAAQAQLTARTQAFVNAPLQLRATREAAENAKKEKWPNTTIRVRFTDRTQLEKVFPSTDKIRSIYAWVRESLSEDVKSTKFILYQPPRRDLKVSDEKVRNLSLVDLQLAPASVLLLRFLDDNLNHANVPAPLAPSVLALAEDLPLPPPVQQTTNEPSSSSKLGSTLGSSVDKLKKPKWLKGLLKS